MTKAEQTRIHTMPDVMVAATGSENRRKLLVEVMDWMKQEGLVDKNIRVSRTSPDKEAGIEESADIRADIVAWEKVLVVALALGLVKKSEVPDELVEKWSHIVTLNSLEKGINLQEHVGIFGGDVVTLIGTTLNEQTNPEEDWTELLKLNRQFTGDPLKDNQAIMRDRAKITALYTRPEGFYVMYKLGIAFLGNDEEGKTRGMTTAWDIMLKFKPLPKSVIDIAYEDKSAYVVGPRVDLANLAPAQSDKAFGVFVRSADSPNDLWKPVELEVMRSLVVGGLLPPHMCIELLAEFAQTEAVKDDKIQARSVTLDISK